MNPSISDLIIELHQLAIQQPDDKTKFAIRKIADDLARVGNEQLENLLAGAKNHTDKGYKVDSLESAEEFMKKRNYNYKDMGDCV
jgi:uncharacterized protein (DUF305 family)